MQFSWLRIGKIILVIILATVFLSSLIFAAMSRPVKIIWSSIIFDRREHYTDCEHLPFYFQVQKVFIDHPDIVTKIKALPGVLDFRPEQDNCKIFEGGMEFVKGQAVLEYQNRSARTQAESLIGKDFFGIPYLGLQH